LTAAYIVVLRHDVSVVPIAAAVLTTMGTLREGWMRAYPGALTGAIVASAAMGVVAYVSFRVLREWPIGSRSGSATLEGAAKVRL